jgi:hypothetical protein
MSRSLLPVAVLAALLRTFLAQEAESHEARLRSLESRLADQEALKVKVAELEAKLARYEEAGMKLPEDSLAEMINGLIGDSPAPNAVVAPRSQFITISGQLRLRFEWRDPFDYRLPGTFGRPADQSVGDDNDRVEQRTRLNFDARVIDDVRVFIQLSDSRLWGEELGVLNETNQVDLHQGYVDIEAVFGAPITVRAGRQELSYGDQRLISSLDWSNIGRAWDGVRAWYSGEGFQLDGFLTNIREEVNGVTDDDHVFGGVYFSYMGIEAHWIDAYILFRGFSDGSFTAEDGGMGDLEDYFAGLRFKGSSSGFDYSAEGVYEFGDRAGDDVGAFGTAVTLGYTFDCECKFRIGLEWTFATGDEDPTDGDLDTFDPPFPFGHAYQGYLDIFTWKNGHDLALKLSVKPHPDWQIFLDVHGFILDEEKDAWYNAATRPIRRDPTGESGRFIGTEVDLTAKWTIRKNLFLYFGYTHFFADDFVDTTGPSPDSDWVFAMLTTEF